MPCFGGYQPPRTTMFSGMSTAQLQAALTSAQAAYVALATGQQGVSFSYTQGDGQKSVTYAKPDLGALAALIVELQQLLGITIRARRPIRFMFR